MIMQRLITEINPKIVVIDALTDFTDLGSTLEVKSMVNRLVDFLKGKNITSLFTGLVPTNASEESGVGVSSTMDTWLHLVNMPEDLRRTRFISVLKSRGMAHSNETHKFQLTKHGFTLAKLPIKS